MVKHADHLKFENGEIVSENEGEKGKRERREKERKNNKRSQKIRKCCLVKVKDNTVLINGI